MAFDSDSRARYKLLQIDRRQPGCAARSQSLAAQIEGQPHKMGLDALQRVWERRKVMSTLSRDSGAMQTQLVIAMPSRQYLTSCLLCAFLGR